MDGEGVSLCPGCAGLAVIVVERPAECGRAVQKEHEDAQTTISEEQGREAPDVVETLPGPRGTQFLGCRHYRRPFGSVRLSAVDLIGSYVAGFIVFQS